MKKKRQAPPRQISVRFATYEALEARARRDGKPVAKLVEEIVTAALDRAAH